MKILHIIASYKPAYVYGGPVMSVSMLAEQLALAGNQVDVYTTTANGKTELPVKTGHQVVL
jgi:glycogen synthase